MKEECCINCKHGSHKCKEPLAPSGWLFYCKFYNEMFDTIGKCEHYQKDSRNNE